MKGDDLISLTPEQYQLLIDVVVSSLMRNARRYGFCFTYFWEEAMRDEYSESFALYLNESLASQGFTPTNAGEISSLLKDAMALVDGIEMGLYPATRGDTESG